MKGDGISFSMVLVDDFVDATEVVSTDNHTNQAADRALVRRRMPPIVTSDFFWKMTMELLG